MMSGILDLASEFVGEFHNRRDWISVGVPSPVVKSTTFAPAPTCAVTHSRHSLVCTANEPRLRGIFRIIEHGTHGSRASLLCRAGGLHRVRQSTHRECSQAMDSVNPERTAFALAA